MSIQPQKSVTEEKSVIAGGPMGDAIHLKGAFHKEQMYANFLPMNLALKTWVSNLITSRAGS